MLNDNEKAIYTSLQCLEPGLPSHTLSAGCPPSTPLGGPARHFPPSVPPSTLRDTAVVPFPLPSEASPHQLSFFFNAARYDYLT